MVIVSTATVTDISKRKQNHLDVCMQQPVESSGSSFFEDAMFIHRALPELRVNEIDTSIQFLGKTVASPLFISCMTGGSDQGLIANKELAKAAQKLGIPLGLGSMRVLFQQPERLPDFQMRALAQDIPIIANIGAVQLKQTSVPELQEWLKKLEVDALAIHLNCGQELFQEGGDTDFKGLKQAIAQTIEHLQLPVIVKETGFGISPKEVKELIEMGAAYIDLAGAGGTNWITVEHFSKQSDDMAANAFMDWGTPTAILLDATREFSGKIIASGGLRSGMDLAKSIALGAVSGGMALPFIQAAIDGGVEEALVLGETINRVLKTTMILTGSRTIADLRQQPLIRSIEFSDFVKQLKTADLC